MDDQMTKTWGDSNLELDLEAQRLAALEVNPSITQNYLKRCSEIKHQLIQKRDRELAVNNLKHETAFKIYRAAFLEDCYKIVSEAFDRLETL